MSSKAAKRSSSTASNQSSNVSSNAGVATVRATSTPLPGAAASRSSATASPLTMPPTRRSRTALSPTRYSRLQEKQDLQNLNDRLACYIDKVRHLEAENSKLTREVQTTQESVVREVSNIKSMYECELADVRKLLDETARERAKLEIDTKRLWDDNEELKIKLEKKSRDLQNTERALAISDTKLHDVQSQLLQSQADRKRLADRERELESENDRLQALVDDARRHLEEETLARIDLENNLQSLKEDLTFKDQVYQQELTETRSRRQVEVSEIDGRLAQQYEARLQEALADLRNQYEAQMRGNREEVELLYETKIKNLTSQLHSNSGLASSAVEELKEERSKVKALNETINNLEAINIALRTQQRELEKQQDAERTRAAEHLAALEAEVARLRDEMTQQLQEYHDLMDTKVVLDLEIAAYRKLLEAEEARLNITPEPSRENTNENIASPRLTPLRGGKRKRTVLEESEERSSTDYSVTGSARGDIEITEADPQGRFVKLTNKGSKEVGLSGWHIVRKAGTLETVFKFHRTAKIEAGGTVTVWSADTGVTHEPPSNIVMKGQKWFIGDCMATKLVNNDGEEIACSERKRQKVSSTISRHRENVDYVGVLEDLHHQVEVSPLNVSQRASVHGLPSRRYQ